MKNHWAKQLQKLEGNLSRTEKQLVKYINRTPETVSSMTLLELSEASEISKPVIINCFRTLGYGDYKSFQASIEQFFASQIDSLRASKEVKQQVNTMEELINKAITVDISALERLKKNLKIQDIKEITRQLKAAKTIYIAGEGTGFYPAHYLSMRLRRYGLKTVIIEQDQRHITDMIHPANIEDMIILFHYSDRDNWMRPLLELTERKGLFSLIISGNIHPDYISLSKMFLHIPRGDLHFKNSMAVPMHFANLLLLSYETMFREQTEKQLTELELSRKIWD